MTIHTKKFPFGIITGIVFLLFAALAVYFSRSGGNIPSMPRVFIDDTELDSEIKNKKTLVRTELSKAENNLLEELTLLHLSESQDPLMLENPDVSMEMVNRVKSLKSSAAHLKIINKKRYLEIGNILALEFYLSFEKVRKLLSINKESDFLKSNAHELKDFYEKGGVFLDRALTKNLIDINGKLTCSGTLIHVLYLVRWRLFAGLEGTAEFTTTQTLAFNDFILFYSSPEKVDERIAAANSIYNIKPDFNLVLAEALINYQAGNIKRAFQILKESVENEQSDKVLVDFMDALK